MCLLVRPVGPIGGGRGKLSVRTFGELVPGETSRTAAIVASLRVFNSLTTFPDDQGAGLATMDNPTPVVRHSSDGVYLLCCFEESAALRALSGCMPDRRSVSKDRVHDRGNNTSFRALRATMVAHHAHNSVCHALRFGRDVFEVGKP